MVRWRQAGYRQAVGTSRPGAPMRNLFGQVDGTGNPPPLDAQQLVHREDGSAAMVVRRAQDGHAGHRFLRRPYNYDDAPGDAGQVFVAFCQDVDEQFLPILRRLSASDAMNEWLTHVGSGVFHVLPGVTSGAGRAYLGSHLLER